MPHIKWADRLFLYCLLVMYFLILAFFCLFHDLEVVCHQIISQSFNDGIEDAGRKTISGNYYQ